jgi:hypothetical protein
VAGVARNFDAWEDLTPYINRDNYDLSVFSGLTVDLHNYPDKGQLGLPIGVGGIARNFDAWDDLTPFIERDRYDLSIFSGLTVEIHNYPDKG